MVILSQNLTWKLNAAGGKRHQLTIGFPKEAAILLIKTQRIKVIDCWPSGFIGINGAVSAHFLMARRPDSRKHKCLGHNYSWFIISAVSPGTGWDLTPHELHLFWCSRTLPWAGLSPTEATRKLQTGTALVYQYLGWPCMCGRLNIF